MQVTGTRIIENIFSMIAQIEHRRTNLLLFQHVDNLSQDIIRITDRIVISIAQFLLIRLADAFGLIRRINPELGRIPLMIIEMRPVCMEDDKHILVRFIQFLFQIRQKGGIVQRGQIRSGVERAHINKRIGLSVESPDHRSGQFLVGDDKRTETGFLESGDNAFLIIYHAIVFRAGGRQDDRYAFVRIVGLRHDIRKMHQAIEPLHPRSRIAFISIQAPLHSPRSLSHHKHVNLALAIRLSRPDRVELEIGGRDRIVGVFVRFGNRKIEIIKRIDRINIVLERETVLLPRRQETEQHPHSEKPQASERPPLAEHSGQPVFHADRTRGQPQGRKRIKEKDANDDKKNIS